MKAFFKKLNFTPFELAEAIVSEMNNVYEKTLFYINRISGKYDFLKNNVYLKEIYKNKRVFLLGNGPSLNDFDLKKLNNEIVIMVNRSFEHPDYEIIKPKYHIFIDPKLATGDWPIEYLEIIYKKNPDVTLLLNAKWYHLEKFSKYRNKKKYTGLLIIISHYYTIILMLI